MTDTTVTEWEKIYDALLKLMSRWGRNQDLKGPDDYLVVSDDWGTPTQRICISNPNLPMDEITREIQVLLADYPSWSIWIGFVDGTPRQSLRVYADKIDQLPDDPDDHL